MKTNNRKDAQEALNKILIYTSSIYPSRLPTLNDLISAWAMSEAGNPDDARKYLQDVLEKNPQNDLATWMLDTFSHTAVAVPEIVQNNDNYKFVRKYSR